MNYSPKGAMSRSAGRAGPGRYILAVLGAASLGASPSLAQVLEIGSDGTVKVYDGPAVVTQAGMAPIATHRVSHAVYGAQGRLRGALKDRKREVWAEMAAAAEAANLSPDLIAAVATQESGLRVDALSAAGAVGVMQLMPSTARGLGVDPHDLTQNLRGGAGYLKAMMQRYDGDLVRALAAYNAGPKAVDRYNGVPPFKETVAYVDAVLDRLSQVAERQAARPQGAGQ